ncbi:MAG: hypothetical protein A4E63_02031 [Syntrophorhabdus sp. PtaU1.Bin050]|nr:MAG: hypothetical protein A4E63_02031 [Syntrophorhabdus sp. PtaU1.Bin050]
MIGKIQGEMLGVMGDLIVTETWLQEGWTGTLEEITPVVPVIERTVTVAREAADKVLKLTYTCNL